MREGPSGEVEVECGGCNVQGGNFLNLKICSWRSKRAILQDTN